MFDLDTPHSHHGCGHGLFSAVTGACLSREDKSQARHCRGKWMSPASPPSLLPGGPVSLPLAPLLYFPDPLGLRIPDHLYQPPCRGGRDLSCRSGAGTDMSRRPGQVSCPYKSECACAGGRNVAHEGSCQAWNWIALQPVRQGPGGWPLQAPPHT